MSKTGDMIHVVMEGDQAWPAVVTEVGEDNHVEATVFAPGRILFYAGPLYGSHADADKHADRSPTRAFSGAPRAAQRADGGSGAKG